MNSLDQTLRSIAMAPQDWNLPEGTTPSDIDERMATDETDLSEAKEAPVEWVKDNIDLMDMPDHLGNLIGLILDNDPDVKNYVERLIYKTMEGL